MERNENSRREFLKKTSLGSLGVFIDKNMWARLPDEPGYLSIHPRYYRWYVDPGEEWLETNTDYATLNWSVPLSQTALVLVDVWQRHYIKDTEARGEAVIQHHLLPLMAACRKAGLKIVHAPSPSIAKQHPNWVHLVSEDEMKSKRDDWPPSQFRDKSGSYKAYSRPKEPREAELQSLPPLTFHPKAHPIDNEPVVATGEELHRYCKQEGILFLLYAGFNTNACILVRDYGTLQMSNRGYEVVMVRDCTTGMESKQTHATLGQTNAAILFLEMFGQYSVTSDEVISGLQEIKNA